MATNIDKIAEILGAKKLDEVIDAGGGAFGAMRLARFFSERMATLRAMKPCSEHDNQSNRELQSTIPMSQASLDKLTKLAENASSSDCEVSPMQIAAELLEAVLAQCEPK